MGLLAVIGPSRNDHFGPPAFWARSLANVRRSSHMARIPCSMATRSGRVGTGRNIGPRLVGGGPSILPAMHRAHEAAPRRPSPFAAAFLSLVFPGLGHAYLGAHRRAIGFAAPPILLGALAAGIAIRLNVFQLAGIAAQSWFLTGLFIVNLVAFVYRAAAIVDAWRIARWLEGGDRGRRLVSAGPRGPRGGAGAP